MNAQSLIELKANRNIPDFRPGDTVRVHAKVIEGERERIQVFEGVVLRIRHRGPASSFTVRRISHGVGVERIFPFHSPLIDKVEVTKVGKVRRAKLYYLRDRAGRSARVRAGDRARFEALTAALPPEEPEEEEDVAVEGAELEEGAEAAVEDTEVTEGEAEAETAAEDAPVAEEAAEAKAEEPASEQAPAAEEPVAEEPASSDEPAPAEEASAEEEPAAEEASTEEEPVTEESTDESEAESSDEKPAEGEGEDSKE